MRKTNKIHKISTDPYEDLIRFEKLDPYEAQIKSNIFLKNTKKLIS